jgi:hypothetical protein
LELERISRSSIKHASIKPTPHKAIPLSPAHLPSAPGVADSVSLVSLSALKGINRLPQGSDLPLGTGDGLTIIFGMNGAGKTSYARVTNAALTGRMANQVIRLISMPCNKATCLKARWTRPSFACLPRA